MIIIKFLLLFALIFISDGDRLDELITRKEKIGIEHIFCILLSHDPKLKSEIHYRFVNISNNGKNINTGQIYLKSKKYTSSIVESENFNKSLNINNDWHLNLESYEIYDTTHKPNIPHSSRLSSPQYKEYQHYEPRDYDMLNGFKALISQYKTQNTTFPNIFGLYSYRDYAEDRRHRNNSYCVIRDENKTQIAAYSLPPIFSQNRFFNSSTYVLIPDFTYFSTFHNYHNHGDPTQDIWFHEIENSKAHGTFKSKKLSAIWRGTYCKEHCNAYHGTSIRSWNSYRTAAVDCNSISTGIDTKGSFVSKRDMCNNYKAMISIPGFGIWTWGLKFALLCDSVTIFPPPSVTGGETWETRNKLGLLPNVHYLPLSGNTSPLCAEINNHLNFIRNNEEKAVEMIKAKREIILGRLNKKEVLNDFANILLKYSEVYEAYDWSKRSMTFQNELRNSSSYIM